ncbi:protein NinF [Escherichia coli]|uniref:protein NinF n=1 Tax=Escherichia coli TaxID=562 RepID=UPI000DD04D41|nr:protein NinF [Escherichia coli]
MAWSLAGCRKLEVCVYQKESVERALTCANCGQKLHVLEVHMCEHCCAELMSDPNSSMYEEEDDE